MGWSSLSVLIFQIYGKKCKSLIHYIVHFKGCNSDAVNHMRYKSNSLPSQFQNCRKIHRLSPAASLSQIIFVLVFKSFALLFHYFFFSVKFILIQSHLTSYTVNSPRRTNYVRVNLFYFGKSRLNSRRVVLYIRQRKMFSTCEMQ
jgi:hypothetical protein